MLPLPKHKNLTDFPDIQAKSTMVLGAVTQKVLERDFLVLPLFSFLSEKEIVFKRKILTTDHSLVFTFAFLLFT